MDSRITPETTLRTRQDEAVSELDDADDGVWWRAIPPAALSIALVTFVFALVFPNLWYGQYDVSDIGIYQELAAFMDEGLLPYRDFDLEYPPLATLLFAAPGHSDDFGLYLRWFSVEMYCIAAALVAIVVATAAALWPRDRRMWVVAVAAPLAIAAVGTIVENRFDLAVALALAGAVFCLTRRRPLLAAAILGLGFAVKLTPALLLPLVLIMAGSPKRIAGALATFSVTALLPFLPYLVMAPGGVLGLFTYHLERPLQIESVLGTPILLGRAFGSTRVDIVTSYGSQGIASSAAEAAATAGTVLMVAAVVGVTYLTWRKRALIATRPELLPVAALAFVLAGMAFGKVLSPQFLIWLVPLAPLVVVRDAWLGGLVFVVLLLTQIGFPGMYWDLVYLETPAIVLLAVRNTLLVAAFGLAVWRLARASGGPPARMVDVDVGDLGREGPRPVTPAVR